VLALFLSVASQAQDLGSLHIADARLPLHRRFVLTVHNRARSDQDLGRYFQARTGAIGMTQLKGRLHVLTGYYFIDQRRVTSDPRDSWHRVFGGPIAFIPVGKHLMLESRTLYERFLSVPTGDFNRFRHRLWFDFPTSKLQPWAQVEGLVTRVPYPEGGAANRFTRRYSAGVGFNMPSSSRLRVGLEYRQNLAGPGTVNLVSIFEWRPTFAR